MPPPDKPSDPVTEIAQWMRYRRLMRRLMLGVVAMVALAVAAVWRHRGMLPVRFAILAALGMGLMMVVVSGLMGLATLRRARGPGGGVGAVNPAPDKGGNPPPARRQSDVPE